MNKNTTYYLYVRGQKVEVSEKIYRSYVQPERKQHMRDYRAKDKLCVISIEELSGKGFDIEDKSQDLLATLIENEEEDQCKTTLNQALRHLKERDRRIIQMVYYKGKTQKEAAESLGIDKSYVSRRIKKILFALKKFF